LPHFLAVKEADNANNSLIIQILVVFLQLKVCIKWEH